jgi:hypothetical protein
LESAGDNSGTTVDENWHHFSALFSLLTTEKQLQVIHKRLWKE